MASAVLPSRNESYWGEGKVYMRKYAGDKPHFNNFIQTNPNPNPSRNRSPSHALTRQIHENNTPWNHNEPPSRPSPAQATAAENGFPHREYLTFNLSAYSRAELRMLEGRLRSELEQVRSLRARIENRSGYIGSRFSGASAAVPPPPSRPPPLQVDFPLESNGALKAKGKKRGIPFGSGRNPKRHNADVSDSSQLGKLLASTMKRCNQILVKLMKHKAGWVFNVPVDAVSLGLHDYHLIIKNPMDLGTVKARLDKKEYKSLVDFASDVRLTFDNARKYNPKGSDVHKMAETLTSLFEKLFGTAYTKFEAQHRLLVGPTTMNSKGSEAMWVPEGLTNTTSVQVVGTPKKLPKPKARDPNKRLMSFEEKEKLGLALQELPAEKTGAMLDIIRQRNSHMTPEGDEIELDIEALDVETLWELDRFVGNHQKAENKMKRQGVANVKLEPLVEQTEEAVVIQKSKKGCDAGEEDVDIGEDIPVDIFPPVEIEKDDDRSSSSSSSDSSSSSGSDSGSSSGSESEEDSVQSPFVESKGTEAVT